MRPRSLRRQLLGWLVPLQGAHRGELFTLQPKNVIGNGQDPAVTLVLNDKFMSGKHAEIAARFSPARQIGGEAVVELVAVAQEHQDHRVLHALRQQPLGVVLDIDLEEVLGRRPPVRRGRLPRRDLRRE